MFEKRLLSFKYAFQGIITLFRTQTNAKIHALAAALVIICAFYFQISTTEWCFLIFAMTMVLSAEAFNTAIEFLTDLVSPDFHPLAEKTKDVASAAVLFTAIGALIIGIIIFLPKFVTIFTL